MQRRKALNVTPRHAGSDLVNIPASANTVSAPIGHIAPGGDCRAHHTTNQPAARRSDCQRSRECAALAAT